MWEERFLKGPRGLLNVPMHVCEYISDDFVKYFAPVIYIHFIYKIIYYPSVSKLFLFEVYTKEK
jgi:hypothetical protein